MTNIVIHLCLGMSGVRKHAQKIVFLVAEMGYICPIGLKKKPEIDFPVTCLTSSQTHVLRNPIGSLNGFTTASFSNGFGHAFSGINMIKEMFIKVLLPL